MDRARQIADLLDKKLAFLQETLIVDDLFYAMLLENEILPNNVIDNIRVSLFNNVLQLLYRLTSLFYPFP